MALTFRIFSTLLTTTFHNAQKITSTVLVEQRVLEQPVTLFVSSLHKANACGAKSKHLWNQKNINQRAPMAAHVLTHHAHADSHPVAMTLDHALLVATMINLAETILHLAKTKMAMNQQLRKNINPAATMIDLVENLNHSIEMVNPQLVDH